MSKVEDLDIDPSLKDLFLKSVNVKDRKTQINIEKKDIIWRKRNLKIVEDRSIINQVVSLWDSLSSAQKTDWETVAIFSGMRGYDLFIQDTSYRILNDLSGVATPNNYHQYKVMKVEAFDSYDILSFTQHHGLSQHVRRFRSGSKNAYDWVLVEDILTGPLTVEFNYFSDMVPYGSYPFWEIIVSFHGLRSGVPDTETFTYNLDYVTGWKSFSEIVTPTLDSVDYYRVKIYGYRLVGVAYFDNFNFEHDSTNYAYDPNCNRVYDKDVLESDDDLEHNWYYNVIPDTLHPVSVYID